MLSACGHSVALTSNLGIAFYFRVIWSFAPTSVALNTARDLGGRFVAAIFWGRDAFPMRYAALSALTNILGTILGALIQILFLADSTRPHSREEPLAEGEHSRPGAGTMLSSLDPHTARGGHMPNMHEKLQLGLRHQEVSRAGQASAMDSSSSSL